MTTQLFVCKRVVKYVEERGRHLCRVHHVPFDDLFVLYARSSKDDGKLVVQIRHAGHILEKITFDRGSWEQPKLEVSCTTALIRSERTGAGRATSPNGSTEGGEETKSDVRTTDHSGSRPAIHHDDSEDCGNSAVTSSPVVPSAHLLPKSCIKLEHGRGRNVRTWQLPRGMWIVVEQHTLNEAVLLSAHHTLEEAEIERRNASRLKHCYCMFLKPLRTSRSIDRLALDLPEWTVLAE